MKIDFKEVMCEDLEGNILQLPPTFTKDFANVAYRSAPTIDIADLARKIFHADKNGCDVELDKEEFDLLVNIFDSVRLLGYPAHVATKTYLENKLKELTSK